MFKKVCVVLVPVVVLAIVIPVAAQEKAKRGQGKRAGERAGGGGDVKPIRRGKLASFSEVPLSPAGPSYNELLGPSCDL